MWSELDLGVNIGCSLAIVFQVRFLINAPPIGVRFRESLVVRLYSEISQINLSIEAQCDIILLPLGDCHTMLF